MNSNKHLVYGILRFLEQQGQNMEEERRESLEVAVQCLETVYGMSMEDPSLASTYPLPESLEEIFKDGLKKHNQDVVEVAKTSSTPPPVIDKEKAERCKAEGNDLMKKENYKEALLRYTEAINADTTNAVYYCNRAAAYSKLNNHGEALADCIQALNIDPSYSKAYGRKGLAHSALEQHGEAVQCYKKAVELDPSNTSYQQNLEIAEQKCNENNRPTGMPPGGPGGIPGMGGLNLGGLDFSSLLNNPALMNMATNMMQNPQMQQMMASFMGNASAAGGEQQQPQQLSSLLQAGQQLAQQMQSSNPELVEELRNQMRDNPDSDQQSEEPNDGK